MPAPGAQASAPGLCRISALAYHLPGRSVTSAEIEADLGLPAGRIKASTGIAARQLAPDEAPSDVALVAAQRCLEIAELASTDLDALIFTGVSRDFAEPATANIIQHKLGANRAFSFDVSNACLGFLNGIQIAAGFIASGQARRILIVCSESGWDPRDLWRAAPDGPGQADLSFAGLTLGHGAAAALIEPTGSGEGRQVLAMEFETFPEHWPLCTWKGPGHPTLTHSSALSDAAIRCLTPVATRLLRQVGWAPGDLDLVIPHQPAWTTVLRALREFGLGENVLNTTLATWGNMITGSVPATLAKAAESGRIAPGARIILAGAASGINVGFIALRW